MLRFFTVVFVLIHCNGYTQVDQKKLDSLSKSIESSSKALRSWQDSFSKIQDSIYQSAVKMDPKQNARNPSRIIEDHEKREEKQRQQAIIRFILGAVILSLLIFIVLRRKQKH